MILQAEGLVEVAVEPGRQEPRRRAADAAEEVEREDIPVEGLARGGAPDERGGIQPRRDVEQDLQRQRPLR